MKNKNKQTKFPVARIKKIMQKDEEVGKVAQATPIVISKGLELFLALIIEEAAKVTVSRGAKKVEAYHLKHAVDTTEMLDFLKEIVETVPDPSAGGTIDLDVENSEGPKRKRGKGKKNGNADGVAGEDSPKKRRRRKADVPAPPPGGDETEEGKSEQEGQGPMDDEEEGDEYGASSSSLRHNSDKWEDAEDPYAPR